MLAVRVLHCASRCSACRLIRDGKKGRDGKPYRRQIPRANENAPWLCGRWLRRSGDLIAVRLVRGVCGLFRLDGLSCPRGTLN